MNTEQQAKIDALRQEWFDIAISTARADRPEAEAAIKGLADLGGRTVTEIIWANSPEEAMRAYDGKWASLRATLDDSLDDSLWESFSKSLGASLSKSLGASLSKSLSVSLSKSLGASLGDSLSDSLCNSLRDTAWVAFYCGGALLGVSYCKYDRRRLDLIAALLRSCFAVWVGPGWAILCERPTSALLVDGKLKGLTW